MFLKHVLSVYLASKSVRECAAKLKLKPAKVRYLIARIKSQLNVESANMVPHLPL